MAYDYAFGVELVPTSPSLPEVGTHPESATKSALVSYWGRNSMRGLRQGFMCISLLSARYAGDLMRVLRGGVVEAASAGLAGAADVFPFEPTPVERADGLHARLLPLRELLHLVTVPEDDRGLGPDVVGRCLAFLALYEKKNFLFSGRSSSALSRRSMLCRSRLKCTNTFFASGIFAAIAGMRVTTQIGISVRIRATSIRQSMDSSKRSPPPFHRRYGLCYSRIHARCATRFPSGRP